MALKLKFKMGGSDPSTPSTPAPETASPQLPKIKIRPPKKISKPTEKETDKRIKLKLNNKKSRKTATEGIPKPANIPRVRVKPTRVPGEGYDSEAPELEDDPLLEQGIVVRFLNDTNLDFVHNAVDSGDFAGLNIKWMKQDKAVVNVNGTLYSARLVDLPTVTEIFKTTDKKNIFKTFDVCQMLLVLHKIENPSDFNLQTDFEIDEDPFYHHPLFKYSTNHELKEKKFVYKDGLTSPFEDVYRRFRPRKVNHRIMDLVDAKVNQMIKADDEAEEFTFDIVDLKKQPPKFGGNSNTPSAVSTPVPRNDFPEMPVEQQTMDEEIEGELEDDMEDLLEDELNRALDGELSIPLGDMNILGTMMQEAEEQAEEAEAEREEEDEEDEEEEEDEDDAEEEEEDQEEDQGFKTGKQNMRLLEEEISELETAAEHNKKNLTTATSRMMRLKFQTAYNNLKASLDAKKSDLAKLKEEQSHTQHPIRQDNGLPAETREDENENDEDEDMDEEGGDDLDDLFL